VADTDERLAALGAALREAEALIERVRPEQEHSPTPCTSWEVHELIGHLVHDVRQYARVARGGAYEPGVDEVTPTGWTQAFADGARDLLSAWGEHESLDDRDLQGIDHETTEFTVHVWDLARATGQPLNLDDTVVERALRWATGRLRPEHRGSEADGRAFGPEVPAERDAPAADRLAAFFGRDPTAWRS
jgi:uncharacterized protein (TIGR03086 family)